MYNQTLYLKKENVKRNISVGHLCYAYVSVGRNRRDGTWEYRKKGEFA
jgi:hypothetical protein